MTREGAVHAFVVSSTVEENELRAVLENADDMDSDTVDDRK